MQYMGVYVIVMRWLLWLWVVCMSVSAELQRFEHPVVKTDDSLSFLAVGDWGRRGAYNQSLIAHQMGIIGEKLNIDFVVSTGDNFYERGLTSVNDPKYPESFTQIYTAQSLQKQWYIVLGNHDYRGNALAQLSSVLRKMDSRWLCLRSFLVNTKIADFFFIDTNPFVDKYWSNPKHYKHDWRGVVPRQRYLSTLLKDLDFALRNSTANWKIVVAHHTIRSVGHHGDTQEIVDQILPILEANNVRAYINGHDHCLEHMSSTNGQIQFLTTGGGSKAWKGDLSRLNQGGYEFYYDGQGFLSAEIRPTDAEFAFYDVSGRVLHRFNISNSKGLHSSM
ncbi:putative Acid phosphatase [Rosa chinensis]|uniref:Purple acid phosphatase n=1 Tax=Rosa chinensis TaxID=74649 RepID=A0A2P6P1Q2_ROSCH|nr:purple acid phosphatase 3 [Rosa chinensis]PRQ15846.1 putative Acid phosphatase [Rosa chinensis]